MADSAYRNRLIMTTIGVSLIIVNYNMRDLMLACLRSIYRHAGSCTFDVILVNKTSDDCEIAAVSAGFPRES